MRECILPMKIVCRIRITWDSMVSYGEDFTDERDRFWHLVEMDHDMFMSSSDLFLLNCVKEDEIIMETTPVDQFLSNSSFDLSHGESI